jgi:hypothetical protein
MFFYMINPGRTRKPKVTRQLLEEEELTVVQLEHRKLAMEIELLAEQKECVLLQKELILQKTYYYRQTNAQQFGQQFEDLLQ